MGPEAENKILRATDDFILEVYRLPESAIFSKSKIDQLMQDLAARIIAKLNERPLPDMYEKWLAIQKRVKLGPHDVTLEESNESAAAVSLPFAAMPGTDGADAADRGAAPHNPINSPMITIGKIYFIDPEMFSGQFSSNSKDQGK